MIRRRYGASPWHLLGHLALAGVVIYVLGQLVGQHGWVNLVAWLVAGAVLHDFVLLPGYSAVDAVLRRTFGTYVNYVRVPLLVSGLLLLIFFPLILVEGDGNFVRNAGHHEGGYAEAWLLISAGLLLAGAATAAARRSGR
jgi:hypothetical protein